jgi:Glyoxalase/Bleomycin resistance protein/Dioxygenase superfamily
MSDGAAGVQVTGVSELVLEVVDLDASESFYSDVLGLPVVERWPDREAIWVMAGERTRIGLWRPQVGLAGGRGGVHVHFAMHIAEADYDAAVALLRERRRALDLGRERAPALRRSGLAALIALLAVAFPAQAAITSLKEGVLLLAASPGEANVITVGPGPDGSLTVTDTGAPLTAGPGCSPADIGVTCVTAGVSEVDVAAGDSDDSVTIDTFLGAFVDGGAGDDVIQLPGGISDSAW